MDNTTSIINKTKSKIPRLPFSDMKNAILGAKYSLSIAFVDEKTSKIINKKYRNKDYPTNVLSFPLSPYDGELVLCLALIKKESKDKNKNFDKNFPTLLRFLAIHGMLHLKGMKHGKKMEQMEQKYL